MENKITAKNIRLILGGSRPTTHTHTSYILSPSLRKTVLPTGGGWGEGGRALCLSKSWFTDRSHIIPPSRTKYALTRLMYVNHTKILYSGTKLQCQQLNSHSRQLLPLPFLATEFFQQRRQFFGHRHRPRSHVPSKMTAAQANRGEIQPALRVVH